jgi:hypothetical protein
MKGYLITTPTDLARRLAAYYGGTVSRPLSQPDICVVMYNGARLAVVSREEDPAGLFLFSNGRGMVKPYGWMFDDALAFVNRVLNVGGVELLPTDGDVFSTVFYRDAGHGFMQSRNGWFQVEGDSVTGRQPARGKRSRVCGVSDLVEVVLLHGDPS